MDILIPSKKNIAAAFSAKAAGYRENAYIQQQALSALIPFVKSAADFELPWLDAGCGAGNMMDLLRAYNVPARMVRTDLAFGTLRRSSRPAAVQSDIEALPFSNGVFGGVIAASVFHWLANPAKALGEIRRTLVASGSLVFSVFLSGSFDEIFSLRRERRLSIPVNLPSADDFSSIVLSAGFVRGSFSTFAKQYRFASAMDALKYMSDTGSTAVSGRRLSPREIIKLCRDYEDGFGDAAGVPLSINVARGLAVRE
jgi:SAM-dependent methyltransferase